MLAPRSELPGAPRFQAESQQLTRIESRPHLKREGAASLRLAKGCDVVGGPPFGVKGGVLLVAQTITRPEQCRGVSVLLLFFANGPPAARRKTSLAISSPGSDPSRRTSRSNY